MNEIQNLISRDAMTGTPLAPGSFNRWQ